jgi:addiction module HigA family antidote
MNNPPRNQYSPDFVTPPGETLLETIEALGMSQVQLAERTGRPTKTISEIINGKTAITPETALQFEKVLGVPARFWINLERNYQEWKAREAERQALEAHVAWVEKFPVKEMIKLGWIEHIDDPVSQLIELLQFFGVASPEHWSPVWEGEHVAFRRSPTFTAQPGVVSVWLRRGELQAQQIACEPYDVANFRAALLEIRSLTTREPQEFVPAMQSLCAKAGVAVVFVHELTNLRTSGATRWLSPTKALIQLSLLYKTDDHLWFTFFHEAGHIFLHGKKDIFLEGNDDVGDKEAEADNFAANLLIPPEKYRNFKPRYEFFSQAEVVAFAHEVGIAPGIVVGRLQHEKKMPITHLNGLKRKLIWA